MNELNEIIQRTISAVTQLKTPLEKVSAESEPMFLKLGNNLQEVFNDAEYLTSLSRETATLVDNKSKNNILGNVGEFSRQSLAQLDECRDNLTSILPNYEICLDNFKRLRDMCPVIKKIAKKLYIVAFNIAVESSRTLEREEMFSFFVKEIKQLAEKVHKIINNILENTETAGTDQIADFSIITEKKDTLNDLADNAHHTVEENVLAIEDLIKMALKVMQRSEIHSNKISSLVGEVVVAIQFHDIARQQMEHIIRTLEDIPVFFSTDTVATDSSDYYMNSLIKAYSILYLQTEQIKQVISEIHDVYKKTKKSFNEIGNEVEALVMEMTYLGLSSETSDRIGNPFTVLISGLGQLNKILIHGKEMARVIEENLNQSAGISRNITGHLTQMEDISMDLHIKAVNALIMSKRLGSEGKTLSILAENVTEVSTDSNRFVFDVVEILKTIRDLAASLSSVSSENKNSIYRHDFQNISLTTGIEMISDVYEDFIQKSSQSMDRSKILKNKLIELESELGFLNEMEETLTIHLISIKNLSESIKSFIPDNIIIDNLDHLRSRYTMEVERGINNKTINRTDSFNKKTGYFNGYGMNQPQEPEENSLGENIELF